jgi:Tfp pilus assembly protein PilF
LEILAKIYMSQKKYAEAASCYKESLAIQEESFGCNHPAVAEALENLAMCCLKMGKENEAERFKARAHKIKEALAQKKEI